MKQSTYLSLKKAPRKTSN